MLDDLLGPELPGRAACAGTAPPVELHIDREPLDVRHATALQTCRTCPVLAECARAVAGEHGLTEELARQTQADPDACPGRW